MSKALFEFEGRVKNEEGKYESRSFYLTPDRENLWGAGETIWSGSTGRELLIIHVLNRQAPVKAEDLTIPPGILVNKENLADSFNKFLDKTFD